MKGEWYYQVEEGVAIQVRSEPDMTSAKVDPEIKFMPGDTFEVCERKTVADGGHGHSQTYLRLPEDLGWAFLFHPKKGHAITQEITAKEHAAAVKAEAQAQAEAQAEEEAAEAAEAAAHAARTKKVKMIEGLYDFPGAEDGSQVAFGVGEQVPMCSETEQPGGGWYRVEKDGKKGIVPSNYVKVVEVEVEMTAEEIQAAF
jgi:hypothetical protein